MKDITWNPKKYSTQRRVEREGKGNSRVPGGKRHRTRKSRQQEGVSRDRGVPRPKAGQACEPWMGGTFCSVHSKVGEAKGRGDLEEEATVTTREVPGAWTRTDEGTEKNG